MLTADPKTVTSHYQKLLYGDPDKRENVLRELRELDQGLISLESAPSEEPEDCGSYDPGLRSESTVEYERKSAAIDNVQILDRNGQRVNILVPTQEYDFCYEVEFLETAYSVRFGMLIKLVTGFELAGQASHPDGEGIERIEAGTRAEVRFRFSARLVPGAYFMNAGVLGQLNGEETYLHRILDVTMFRVQPSDRNQITGFVDLSAEGSAQVKLEAGPSKSRRSA